MDDEERVARAIALCERSTDADFLMSVIREVAPRARRLSTEAGLKLGDDNVPGPAAVSAASQPATNEETLEAARDVHDFPLLQALARSAGRRLEEIRRAN